MLNSLRRYAKTHNKSTKYIGQVESTKGLPRNDSQSRSWEAENLNKIQSTLILAEAELIVAKGFSTMNRATDYNADKEICELEIEIAYLKQLLQAKIKIEGNDEHTG